MAHSTLLYGLRDNPGNLASLTAAFQHVLASFVGVVTPTLIICNALALETHIPFLVSMALFVTGLGTFIQTRRVGPVGSGLVAVQGTSFAFISALIIAGAAVRNRGGSDHDVLAMMLGITLAGALVEVVLSFFIVHIKRVLNPVVTGIVITAIGLSLIKVGMSDLAGGMGNDEFGNANNVLLGLGVLLLIIFLNATASPWLRLSAIFIGMLVGSLVAWFTGNLSFESITTLPVFSMPTPFAYGIDFDFGLFLPVALIYLFSAIETAGDLTANSLFCREPIKGPVYLSRIKGGILGDGVNSLLAGMFNSFPNTTFGQNNGVIQLTGIASRKVGFVIAGLYLVLGFFPLIGGILQVIPKSVLGGATLVMFAMVAVGGLKILTCEPMNRRSSLITASSLGIGIGVMMVPEVLSGFPDWLANILASPVTLAGLTAIFLDLSLPPQKDADTSSDAKRNDAIEDSITVEESGDTKVVQKAVASAP